MKEKILNVLSDLGFVLECTDEVAYAFEYEAMHMVYLYNEDDEDFLHIALPCIMEVDDLGKTVALYALIDKINATLKYVKVYILGQSIWMLYEREIIGEEDLKAVIQRMIISLENGLLYFRKEVAEMGVLPDDDTAEDDNTDAMVDATEVNELDTDNND